MKTDEILVDARDLVKTYNSGLRAVDGITFQVRRGEAFGVLGANGAGKSSTMRMVACTSPVSGGTLRVLGGDPDRDGAAVRARLGVVPQEDSVDTDLTVRENLLIYGRYFGMRWADITRRTTELLEFARLTERADEQVSNLSGGMRRRLTIARALINDPAIVLLDEPTTGLDPQARHLLWERLFQLKQDGVTLLLTTHYMDEAEQLCDRLIIMDGGKIIAEGTPADLIARYSTREVLELRFPAAEREVAAEKLQGLTDRVDVFADRVLLYTANGEETLAAVHERKVTPLTALVRRSTLEDVFLTLTGRTLVD
ncbi:ABC transporter ATP-binding protein [Dactylosporangium aurantiacum]|uniref:ABC transporter ATP-binding protein n=1 Tax=Dactylosporangium aurantiacum TaxID=35754 RepID=A0A9Q9INS4_9ACTN|nr:ABC transporter ATP-binding protein [Dactylosporangium aurantiacum]MDG6103706.1 ABC transporter ATP-binding protein [Dactylosporangium aurantiacum]UWZ59076.1 ABC transporter ATP-binding protein [Dactylosporangium aurantiacum]